METVVEKGADSFFGLNITAVLAHNSASCHGRIFSLQTMIVVAHESSYNILHELSSLYVAK